MFEVTEDEGVAEFFCAKCNMKFNDIEAHQAEFHPETEIEETAVEPEAEDEFTVETEGMAFVIKDANGKYECPTCLRTYRSLRWFIDHTKTHENVPQNVQDLTEIFEETERKSDDIFDEIASEEGANFRCRTCKIVFSTKKQMRLHYSIHVNVESAKKKNIPDKDAPQSFHCNLCNRSLKSSSELKMHMSAHTGGSRQTTATQVSPKQTKKNPGDKATYPCQYCKKEFKRPHEMVKHERVHTGEKPFSCDICGKQFRVTYCLSLHKRNVHSEERPYICSFEGCNKRFKSQSVYNHHINTHSTTRNYKCPTCSKAFKTSVQLAGHKKTHTKPFSCENCKRAFASLYAVKVHMEVHKDDRNLKHTCNVCGSQYGRLFALKDHLKTAHPESENAEIDDTEEHFVIEESQESIIEEHEVYSVVI